jgi:GTP cyclohydrolase II
MYGIYYAPEGTGAAPYNTSLSRGLARRGWDVTVITGVPHYPSWRREPLGDLPEIPGLTVERRDHFIPAKQSVLTRALYEASWLATGAATFMPKREVDVVLGVTPGLSGATLAMAAAARYKKPFVLWAHDLVGQTAQQSGFSGGGKVAGLISSAEVGLAKRADRVVVFADGYTRYFAANGVDEGKIYRVRHWAHGAEAEAAVDAPSHRAAIRARLGWKDDEIIVLHGGNMGFKQGLDNVLETAALAKGRKDLRFVLLGERDARPRHGDPASARSRSRDQAPRSPPPALRGLSDVGGAFMVGSVTSPLRRSGARILSPDHVALGDGRAPPRRNGRRRDVLVRVHSECLTGEVFHSLKCDCREQLDMALKRDRASAGQGLVLYLRQEGRGIGLGNKIRAYQLKSDGHDTVDANRVLGFDDDARSYDIAAGHAHGTSASRSIRLMTNNPEKVSAMRALGVTIESRVAR